MQAQSKQKELILLFSLKLKGIGVQSSQIENEVKEAESELKRLKTKLKNLVNQL